MPMSINQNSIEEIAKEAEDMLRLEALKTSKHPDSRNIFKHEEKEKAFFKRYGKKVLITVTYEGLEGQKLDSFDHLKEYTLRFQSPKNNHYAITEYLKNGDTEQVILSYRKNGRNIENSFKRHIDAEVTLADLLGDE